MIVGEAWGEQESRVGLPFIGQSGQELTRMLWDAGISRSECLLTNVFPLRPEGNKIESLCVSKALSAPGTVPLRQGKYFRPDILPEVARLHTEITEVNPNLVLALGNTACWALLSTAKISAIRGTVTGGVLVPGVKVLPTYHPAAVLRSWDLRVVVVADLMKAKREAAFPGIVRPKRQVLILPTLDEIAEWFTRPAEVYACDIETSHGQITCVGFARSATDAIVIPFVDWKHPSHSYWPTLDAELAAWRYIKSALEGSVPKLFQNGLYDLQYLAKMGFQPQHCIHDTMLLHHSLYPELQKGLGFLGSIYTNEASWKLLRKNDSLKKDE